MKLKSNRNLIFFKKYNKVSRVKSNGELPDVKDIRCNSFWRSIVDYLAEISL